MLHTTQTDSLHAGASASAHAPSAAAFDCRDTTPAAAAGAVESDWLQIVRAYESLGVPIGEARARSVLPHVQRYTALHGRAPGFRELMGWWVETGPSRLSASLN
jgi:hypothetical protein